MVRAFLTGNIVIAALASVALCAGCGKPTARHAALRPSQVHDFAQLFQQNCVGCHGAEGKLGPAPPLNDSLFLTIAPPNELRRVINEGRHGTMMPAFGREQGGALTPLQVDVLIDGMLRWNTVVPDAVALPTYLALTERDAAPPDHAIAEKLFAAHCGECHGVRGEGGSGGALRVPAFLALVSDQALRRIAITGRPDLGMPNYRDRARNAGDRQPLTSAEINAIVALLASWREEAQAAPAAAQAMR